MVEGDSAWKKRHKQGHFKGDIIQFGALIDFRPLEPILNMFPKFEKRFPGYSWDTTWWVVNDSMETTWWHPLLILRNHQQGGVRICRIAEIIIDKAEDYKFPLRESKDKNERSLENAEINYVHMFDNKTEDNTVHPSWKNSTRL